MDETPSLSTILDGGSAPAQTVEAPATQGTSTQAQAPTDAQKTGEPAKAIDAADSPTPATPKKEQTDADKAFATLRREVREAKKRAAAAEAAAQAMNAPPKPALDPLSMEPDAFEREINSRISEAVLKSKIQSSTEAASEKYDDFWDMVEVFDAQFPPGSAGHSEMLNARNPAEFAYKTAKEAKARQEIGDPVQYGEKIRQEATAKAMADIDKIVETKLKERLAGLIPSSLVDTQTQGGRVTNPNGFNGPTPLDEILKSK